MVEKKENDTYQEELPDYEEEETAPDHVVSKGATDADKTSGFKNFLLEPELHRSGFEHPSEARKARINAVWDQLNCNGSSKMSSAIPKSYKAPRDKPKLQRHVPEWMVSLGMASKKPSMVNSNIDSTQAFNDGLASKRHHEVGTKSIEASEEAKKIAAAALAAVKDATALNKGGKIEVNEVRNFAGEEVKLRKYVDPNSMEAQIAQERTKIQASSTSSLDALLEQISKKRKLNILDKSKKDWGDFKEKEGLEDELDAYKKSSDKYLDKVSFLQRADLREYEREREVRLAQLSKRRADSQRD